MGTKESSLRNEPGEARRRPFLPRNKHEETPMAEKIPNNYFDGIPTSRKQLLALMCVVFAYFFDQIDNNVLGFAAPSIMRSFGIGMTTFAPAQSLYFIGMMVGGILGGLVSDRIGRRRAFMLGCALFSTFTFLTGVTNSLAPFVIFRVLTGVCIMGTVVVCVTYMIEITSKEERGKWPGICSGVGNICVPVIGLVAVKVIPLAPEAWRWLFYQGLLGFIPLILAWFFLKESPRWLIAQGRRADAERAVKELSGVDVDLSAVVAAETAKAKTSVWETLTSLLSDKKYLRRTLILFIITAGQNIPSFIFLGWNNTFLQAGGVPQADALLICTIGSVAIPLGVLFSGYIGPMGGRKIPLAVTMLLSGLIAVFYINAGSDFHTLTILYFAFQFVSMCCAMCLMPYLSESYPTTFRSTGSGVVLAGGRLSVSASQQIAPAIFAASGFFGIGAFIVAFCLLGGLTTLGLGWRTGKRALEDVC